MPRLDTRAVGELWAFKTHLLIRDFSEGERGVRQAEEFGGNWEGGVGEGGIAKASLSSDSA